jgi:hypothetical protein
MRGSGSTVKESGRVMTVLGTEPQSRSKGLGRSLTNKVPGKGQSPFYEFITQSNTCDDDNNNNNNNNTRLVSHLKYSIRLSVCLTCLSLPHTPTYHVRSRPSHPDSQEQPYPRTTSSYWGFSR